MFDDIEKIEYWLDNGLLFEYCFSSRRNIVDQIGDFVKQYASLCSFENIWPDTIDTVYVHPTLYHGAILQIYADKRQYYSFRTTEKGMNILSLQTAFVRIYLKPMVDLHILMFMGSAREYYNSRVNKQFEEIVLNSCT